MDTHDRKRRDEAIQEARSSSLLDACATIYHYNVHIRPGGPLPWPEVLSAEEALGTHDESAYKIAMGQASKLYDDSLDVGLAFFKYPSATLSYEEAEDLFKRNNPGFSETHYGRAIGNAIRGLR